MSERTKIIAGFLIVSTVWGSTWLAIKLGLQTVPPFLAAGMRFVIAATVLYGILRWQRGSIPMTAVAWRVYLALGIFTFSIPFALVYWGARFVPSGLSSILFAAFPFWVAIFSLLMLRDERPDAFKIGAIVLGFAGVYIIFSDDLAWSAVHAAEGMGAIMISVVLQAYSLIVVKKHGHAISPFAMNFVGMVMGAATLLALSAAFERDAAVLWSATALGSLAYLSLIGSVLTFVSYYWLLQRLDAVYLSLSSFINPIVAVLLGWLVLGESLSGSVAAGAGLVLAGIVVANGKGLYAKFRSPA